MGNKVSCCRNSEGFMLFYLLAMIMSKKSIWSSQFPFPKVSDLAGKGILPELGASEVLLFVWYTHKVGFHDCCCCCCCYCCCCCCWDGCQLESQRERSRRGTRHPHWEATCLPPIRRPVNFPSPRASKLQSEPPRKKSIVAQLLHLLKTSIPTSISIAESIYTSEISIWCC